ncbi:hypothetical protein Tco_1080713 [Tanacetum coccineum]|uniref:Uncharacterized protein n=1 Tax=Tanacetum coccineum TaxID=301880 RepID=A0ABQ5HXF2_9ASTR
MALHGTILGLQNYRLESNQSTIMGRVHIHTINKGLIREELSVKVKGKAHRISVVEEVGDITSMEIQEVVTSEQVSKVGVETGGKTGENDMQIDEEDEEDGDDDGDSNSERKGGSSDEEGDGEDEGSEADAGGCSMPEKIFGNGNDGEDEGSRFSGKTKVSDTFEADLGSLKKKAAGNSKYMYGKCKGNNATDTGITRKEGPTDEFKNNGNKNNNDKDLCGEMEDIRSGLNLDQCMGQNVGQENEKEKGLVLTF